MNYCRGMQFTEDPDYRKIFNMLEGAMERNGVDPKVPDFIWNKNRLALEKEQLKQNMLKAIKPKEKQDGQKDETDQGKGKWAGNASWFNESDSFSYKLRQKSSIEID